MKQKRTIPLIWRIIGILVLILFLSYFLMTTFDKRRTTTMQTPFPFQTDPAQTCFTNDLGVTNIGDPFVLQIAPDEYYMYCTSAPNGFYCWKSNDLIHWGERKMCYVRQPDAWCIDCFWAPEVIAHDGQYYMYYSAKSQAGSMRIGLAISDQPDGPFLDVRNEPFFDFGYAVIDANVFVDDDGAGYLYYVRDCSENKQDYLNMSEIYGVRLSDDLLSVAGDSIKLLTPEQKWEKSPGDTWWNEGPEMIKHDNQYYLTYSANFFASPSYSLGYAVSDAPLGTFVKAQENPLLTSGLRSDVSGTGHHSFTYSPDGSQIWAVYHSHTTPENPGGNRKVNIDRVGFTPDGKLFISGPTTTTQPAPSGVTTTDVTQRFQAHLTDSAPAAGTTANFSLLTDGMFSVSKRHAWLECEIAAEQGTADITLTTEKTLPVCGIALYPGIGCEDTIASVQLCLGGEKISEQYIADAQAASPLLLYFEPCETDTIEISLSLREGSTAVTLSEISVLSTVTPKNE